LVLFYAVSLIFALLVAYETVVERESRQRIRSDETATWSYRILSERPPTPPGPEQFAWAQILKRRVASRCDSVEA
jgi:hypothetical protein